MWINRTVQVVFVYLEILLNQRLFIENNYSYKEADKKLHQTYKAIIIEYRTNTVFIEKLTIDRIGTLKFGLKELKRATLVVVL